MVQMLKEHVKDEFCRHQPQLGESLGDGQRKGKAPSQAPVSHRDPPSLH